MNNQNLFFVCGSRLGYDERSFAVQTKVGNILVIDLMPSEISAAPYDGWEISLYNCIKLRDFLNAHLKEIENNDK